MLDWRPALLTPLCLTMLWCSAAAASPTQRHRECAPLLARLARDAGMTLAQGYQPWVRDRQSVTGILRVVMGGCNASASDAALPEVASRPLVKLNLQKYVMTEAE